MSLLRSNSITVLFTCFVICFLVSPAQAKYSGVGNGEPNNPYRIADANDMNEIGTHPEDWGSHFLLVNDINLADYTGTQFNIIGDDWDHPFAGVFDGNGHTISNFTYNSTDVNHVGIFGFMWGATIKDLILSSPDINAVNSNNVGALAGEASFPGMITSCRVEGGTTRGDGSVGGLVGRNSYTILNCYATGTVDGDSNTGGLVGANNGGGQILNCYSTGNVNGNVYTGGLLGAQFGYTKIFNSYQSQPNRYRAGARDPLGLGR